MLKTSEKSKNYIFQIKTGNCNYFVLKPPCVGVFTTHTTRQKANEKLKIFYSIVVQGENTIARRQRFKSFSIVLTRFNSFPKYSKSKQFTHLI